eukprot:15896-Heterococcus_DN1.PRE.5
MTERATRRPMRPKPLMPVGMFAICMPAADARGAEVKAAPVKADGATKALAEPTRAIAATAFTTGAMVLVAATARDTHEETEMRASAAAVAAALWLHDCAERTISTFSSKAARSASTSTQTSASATAQQDLQVELSDQVDHHCNFSLRTSKPGNRDLLHDID